MRQRIAKQRAYILGFSATSILKWMGAHGWTIEQATKVVRKLATGLVSHNTVVTGLNDGRSPTYCTGMASLSQSQIAELEEARDSDDDETTPAPVVEKIVEIREESEEIARLKAKIDFLSDRIEEVAAKQPKKVHITITTPEKTVEMKEHIHPIFEQVMFHVNCGDNVMLVGPKGCGKTKLCEQIAKALGRKFGAISLSGGVTESKLFGRLVPNITNGKNEFHSTPLVDAASYGHVFLLDEVDRGDPNVLLSLNMLLANRKMVLDRAKDPIVDLHEDFLCLAAANTWGSGADRQYVGANQQDGAFTERFVQLDMDYDTHLEESLCPNFPELVERMHNYRAKVRANRMEREVSTRFILRAYNWMLHGKDLEYVDTRLFGGWRRDEIAKVKGSY